MPCSADSSGSQQGLYTHIFNKALELAPQAGQWPATCIVNDP